MRDPLKVYIGYDRREHDCYEVARHSLLKRASVPVCVTPIELERNEMWGLMRRPREYKDGQMYDTRSNAPMSTEFAISRFLTPLLAQKGWALFVDSDVVFHADVAELFAIADPQYAVMCVKHQHTPVSVTKMDGQAQTIYARKNWSSVMLFNCEHPANFGLGLAMLNQRPGRDLHRFCWLFDEHIGALPAEWNWLVGEQPRPAQPKIAHYTLGGAWFQDWQGGEYDDEWKAALQAMRSDAKCASRATAQVS
mgnify:CR=1 FL=1